MISLFICLYKFSCTKNIIKYTLCLIGQDQLVRLGNYCCSSIRVAIDEKKNSNWKITMTHTETTCSNRIALRAGKKGARPVGVGAQASVFEKSATELKQQKLLKCKHTIQIPTFNIRTLNRIGQLPELTASAIDHKIDIIFIQEHRYTHSEDIKYHDTGNGWTVATASTWKNSVNATIWGVGLLIGPRAQKSLNSIEKIHPRMMVATFNGNPRVTIISCHNHTNIIEETKHRLLRWAILSCAQHPETQRSRHSRRHECPNRETREPQIQPTQLVKQEWITSYRFCDRK